MTGASTRRLVVGENTNVSRDVGAVQASLDCQLEDENRATVNVESARLGWKVEVHGEGQNVSKGRKLEILITGGVGYGPCECDLKLL